MISNSIRAALAVGAFVAAAALVHFAFLRRESGLPAAGPTKASPESWTPTLATSADAPVVSPIAAEPFGAGEGDERDSVRDSSRPADAAPTTARSILEGFWGDRWAEVERSYREIWCVALGDPDCLDGILGAEFESWESASESLGAMLAADCATQPVPTHASAFVEWPMDGELTAEQLRARFKLPADQELRPEDVVEVSALVEEDNRRLTEIAGDWRRAVDEAVLGSWARGAIQRAPFFVPPTSSRAGVLHVRGVSTRGWAVQIVVRADEHPWIADLVGEADRLRAGRDARVRAYLRGER